MPVRASTVSERLKDAVLMRVCGNPRSTLRNYIRLAEKFDLPEAAALFRERAETAMLGKDMLIANDDGALLMLLIQLERAKRRQTATSAEDLTRQMDGVRGNALEGFVAST